ncbi:MAG: CopD family protein, partial [Ktedonobacteraceae bacterium]|nr:CopD family protein [Ktedonobacteraceae bacterium]
LALLIAMTFSGHAASVTGQTAIYAILSDWLHLLAVSLWVGGMLYLALAYLPVLKGSTPVEQARALLTTLPHFTPLAIAGVIIMALSGPFNATVHLTSWAQLYQTAYGRSLIVKVLLVAALLGTSAIHVGLFRPRLAKDYKKYQAIRGQDTIEKDDSTTTYDQATVTALLETKLLAQSIGQQTRRLIGVLRWEPLLGVAVLLCTAAMAVFAGTLTPTTSTSPGTNQQQQVKPFTDTVKTSDGKYTITLTISPNRFGPNTFTARVMDSNGKLDTNVGVSLYTTMLDMDMGTDTINLQPDGKGNFSASGDLAMAGHWQLRIQVRTPDNKLHEAKASLTVGQ